MLDIYLQNKILQYNIHPVAEMLKPYIQSYYKGYVHIFNVDLYIYKPMNSESFSYCFFQRQIPLPKGKPALKWPLLSIFLRHPSTTMKTYIEKLSSNFISRIA